ncbi:prolyl-tRNA editing enzyme YbaK/EbsC (Cys-tRNA(Pro) deacylase) [Mycobacterium frederiksbergense]|uniref:Prolyl-tRNA editing enzyme YbaK/EbsC (Cys-tRNA(Pro) deacylase) n=1 Tax=Mycolicibacterium frederiksbergense TaxID=117567 RepID=A0ABT6L818_9MYCO|nr:YbaK/EbsC family protein [Mycolicibacterium frederiksbergense]MDH6198377.1 prolyl-tRNA editing enzyme YbaK/EbsC (Cys-tRNA(Pro) deacylase) [Mycolicibacterium frederiksbergense]
MNERNALVANAVAAAGIEPAITILDADAKTAAAAAGHLGCEIGAIANSLVFECDGAPLLVMASGAARVNTDVLAQQLGATKITKADPSLVRRATGQIIGGVAPVGHPEPLRTVVDPHLAAYPVIWTAAGTADSVMPLTYHQLLALTGGLALPVR